MQRILFSLFFLILTQPAFAMLCPKNFNVINIGDSLAQVIQACGDPDTKKAYKSTSDGPQEWNFYIPPAQISPGLVKMTVLMSADKVANINVNGVGLAKTAVCGGRMIQIGDTKQTLQSACGKPSFIKEGDSTPDAANPQDTNNMTDLIYNSTPPVTLVFEDGKLKEKK